MSKIPWCLVTVFFVSVVLRISTTVFSTYTVVEFQGPTKASGKIVEPSQTSLLVGYLLIEKPP